MALAGVRSLAASPVLARSVPDAGRAGSLAGSLPGMPGKPPPIDTGVAAPRLVAGDIAAIGLASKM